MYSTFVKSAPYKTFAQKTDSFKDLDNFLISHSTYSKKKSFNLLEGKMNPLGRSKMEETAQFSKKGFLKNS